MTLTPVEAREGRVLRERLGYGLCGLDDVERWADRLIERMEEPPYGLIQLGLARTNGVDVCFEALEELGIGTSSPDEVVLALALVDTENLSPEQLHDMLTSIWPRAIRFEVDDGLGDLLSVQVLYRATVPYDDFLALTRGEIAPAQFRATVGEYFREIREAAASLEAGT